MIRLALVVGLLLLATAARAETYKPTWDSIDNRPLPGWFDDAKFGIFIHWGVYSVPAWGPKGKYAEWYWNDMMNKEGETWKFHAKTYGEDFRYQDFAPMFKAEMFDPTEWADIFARSGAKYIVLTSKHHEGFPLWPSAQSWNWNAMDVGPHRDLAGDLSEAVKARGLKMGFYYSLYEWFNPLYKSDVKRYVDERMLPQLKDLVERYKPAIIWPDGEWDHPSDVWRSTEFLAWLYNESSVKDEVVVDDRWGKDCRSKHGGFYTTEYGDVGKSDDPAKRRKWEECRGIGASFGYNRNENIDQYATPESLVHLLINIVCRGGNLLLDIGPTADGRIPVIMEQRLLEMGDWLKVNGEAIYGTHPWRESAEGDALRYTAKDGAVYAICLKWPGSELVLKSPKTAKAATLLGCDKALQCRVESDGLHIAVPALSIDETPTRYAHVFKLDGAE